MKIIYKIFNKIVYITRSFLIVFITLIILLIILFIFGENFFCKNKVITSVISSNKKIKIVIFQRDCGATTGFTTQISIINSNEIVDNTMKGNIFISDGKPQDIIKSIKWIEANKVVVKLKNMKYKIYKKEKKYNIGIFRKKYIIIIYDAGKSNKDENRK